MVMKLIKRGLTALGLASLAIAPTAAEARTSRGPALWQVSDKDTTVYLFGTIHMLRGNYDLAAKELASAHALWQEEKVAPGTPIQFHTRSGVLGA